MQLAHAGDDRLAGLVVGPHLEGGVLLGERASALPSLSWSTLVFGSMATEITGSGNSMRSSTIGCDGSQSVSPVVVFFSPTAATMSPAKTASLSSRWFACICRRRPMRSFLSFVALSTGLPAESLPE